MTDASRESGVTRHHLVVGLLVFLPIAVALVILVVVILNTLRNGQWASLTVALVFLVVANIILYVGMDTITER